MKKKLIVLVTFLFVLVSILGVLVACEDAKYTVTFKNGDTTVKEVQVAQGSALAASDIPADPTAPERFVFDGWYVGETKVEAGYKPTSDVTAVAKFVETVAIVKFVAGETVVKEVTIDVGEVIPDNKLPGEPTAEEAGLDPDIYKEFLGWFDAEGNQFVETAAVTGSVTYTAKFNKVAVWTVRFIDGDNVVTVEVAQSLGKLKTVPSQAAVSGKIALGWYTADCETIAVEGMDITADTDFYAMSVGQEDYAGAWLDTEAHRMIIFTADNKVIIDGQSRGRFYEAGKVTVAEGSGYSRKEWTLSIVGSKLKVQYGGYDQYEDWETASYTLTKGAEVDYAGTYRNGQYIITVMNGGAISTLFAGNQGGGIYNYAVMIKDGEGYKIEYLASDSATQLTEVSVTLEDGVLVVEGASSDSYNGWYLQASECVTYSKYETGVGYYRLYVYTTESGVVYVYSTPEEIHFATVEGEIQDGAIITIKVAEREDVIVKISGSDIVFEGEEAGTYTGTEGSLVLDGFGKATLDGQAFEYTYTNGRAVVTDFSVAYALNIEEHTYEALTNDGYKGTYTRNDDSKYVIVLDGFGTFQFIYNKGTPSVGTYTISGTTMTVAGASSGSGKWTIALGGKVLVYTTTSAAGEYVLEGFDLPDPNEEFDGTWESGSDTVVINLEAKTINYKGQVVSFTASFDGTTLTFKAKDSQNYFPNNTCEFTVTLEGSSLKIVHERVTGYDDVYDEYPTQTITETFTKKEVVELDAFAGEWKDTNNNTYKFDGKGTVIYNGTSYSYTINAQGQAEFFYGYYVVCTLSNSTTMSCYFNDGYDDDFFTVTATKQ